MTRDVTDLKPVYNRIDLSTWCFDDNKIINKLIQKAATEAIRNAFKDEPPWIGVPFEHTRTDGLNGKPTDNLFKLCVALPLGCGFEPVWYGIDLRKYFLKLYERMTELGAEEKFKLAPKQLRDLADKLERQIK